MTVHDNECNTATVANIDKILMQYCSGAVATIREKSVQPYSHSMYCTKLKKLRELAIYSFRTLDIRFDFSCYIFDNANTLLDVFFTV